MLEMNKKQLAILLSQLKENQNPKPDLEQYTIPGELAAQIINTAYLSGDIKDKRVLDLGCGSGRLGIGAVLMEAKEVIGIDVDKNVLKIAEENLKIAEKLSNQRIKDKIRFISSNVSEIKEKVDTVIQNPPFGIQKSHADRLFLEKALECSNKVYSLHRSYSKTRNLHRN